MQGPEVYPNVASTRATLPLHHAANGSCLYIVARLCTPLTLESLPGDPQRMSLPDKVSRGPEKALPHDCRALSVSFSKPENQPT